MLIPNNMCANIEIGNVIMIAAKMKSELLRLGQYLFLNMSAIIMINAKEPTRSNIAMPEILCSLNVAIDIIFFILRNKN